MSASESTDRPKRRTVTLVKAAHRWRFTWSVGDEQGLLCALADLAEERDNGFEWFDAAVVSQQMGRRLGAGLHKVSSQGIQG